MEENYSSINLPEESGLTLETLRSDILDSIDNGKASRALDRLHTFTTGYLRNRCKEYGLPIKNDSNDYLPLHSLIGQISKYYEKNNLVESKFSLQALKVLKNLFSELNNIRNHQSYAHLTEVLNENESKFVVEIVSSVLTFIDTIKPEHPEWHW